MPLVHDDRIEALRFDHGIGERVDRRRRVGDDPLLCCRRQAVAEPHAKIIQQPADVHCAIVAVVNASCVGRTLPGVRAESHSYQDRGRLGAGDSRLLGMGQGRLEQRRRSLSELEADDWGQAPDGATPLAAKVHAYRRKPIGELTDEELRLLVGQNEGLLWLVPMAIERLESDPCVAGDLYAGALRTSLERVKVEYWIRHPDLAQRLAAIPGCVENQD
jgi:CDI immunity proteins